MNTSPLARVPLSAALLFVASAGAQDCAWENLGPQPASVFSDPPRMVAVDDGDGLAVFIGGELVTADSQRLAGVSRFDGERFTSVGQFDPDALITDMGVFDLGQGPRLIVSALVVGGGSQVFLLEGEEWLLVGPQLRGRINALAVLDHGAGPVLYAAGDITFSLEGRIVRGIVQLIDDQWRGLPSVGAGGVFGQVIDMVVFDDGSGPAVYLAGDEVTVLGSGGERGVARWDGVVLSSVEGGPIGGEVRDLLVFDDGHGEALYLGGFFDFPVIRDPLSVASWDGEQWSILGGEFETEVFTLAGFDFGLGPTLFAGSFGEFDDPRTEFIGQWNGVSWVPLPQRLNGGVSILLGVSGPGIGGLYALGGFDFEPGRPRNGLGRVADCELCETDLDQDGESTVFDFLAFVGLYEVGSPRADFDGDGVLTTFDLVAFGDEFDAGCP